MAPRVTDRSGWLRTSCLFLLQWDRLETPGPWGERGVDTRGRMAVWSLELSRGAEVCLL
jgi:hypothetical protein